MNTRRVFHSSLTRAMCGHCGTSRTDRNALVPSTWLDLDVGLQHNVFDDTGVVSQVYSVDIDSAFLLTWGRIEVATALHGVLWPPIPLTGAP